MSSGFTGPRWAVIGALVVVYIVWGSTYGAIGVVVASMPPLGSMGLRFLAAGLILLGLLALKERRLGGLALSRSDFARAALLGLILLVGSTGMLALGETQVATGVAAVLSASAPLWVVLLRRVFGHETLHLFTLIGVAVGIAGITLLVSADLRSSGTAVWALAAVLVASVSWAVGSYLSAGSSGRASSPLGSAWQMLVGGSALLVLSAVFERDWSAFADAGADAWLALLYLLVFGSFVGYSAFVWLTRHAPISVVSTHSFVNPVVAVIIGVVLMSETLTPAILVGCGICVVGVAFVVRGETVSR